MFAAELKERVFALDGCGGRHIGTTQKCPKRDATLENVKHFAARRPNKCINSK